MLLYIFVDLGRNLGRNFNRKMCLGVWIVNIVDHATSAWQHLTIIVFGSITVLENQIIFISLWLWRVEYF